jgi:hypothetical protein
LCLSPLVSLDGFFKPGDFNATASRRLADVFKRALSLPRIPAPLWAKCRHNKQKELTMKLMHPVAFVALALLCLLAGNSHAQNAEEAAARKPLENYLRGHATGDSAYFKAAFHPEAKLFWMREGKLMQRTSAQYISGATGKPAEDEAQRKRHIASLDITGNSAVAKIVLDYPNALITDYMSLLKVDGEWKIMNKIFYVEPKKK